MQHERRIRRIPVETHVDHAWKQKLRYVDFFGRKVFRNLRVHFDIDRVIDMLAQPDAGQRLANSWSKHLMAVSSKSSGVVATFKHSSNRLRVVIANQQIDIAHWTLAGRVYFARMQ